jgi:hypothetical protein
VQALLEVCAATLPARLAQGTGTADKRDLPKARMGA